MAVRGFPGVAPIAIGLRADRRILATPVRTQLADPFERAERGGSRPGFAWAGR
jgi:hypothetical protein